jgi:hypothetical protein
MGCQCLAALLSEERALLIAAEDHDSFLVCQRRPQLLVYLYIFNQCVKDPSQSTEDLSFDGCHLTGHACSSLWGQPVTEVHQTWKIFTRSRPSSIEAVAMSSLAIFTEQSVGPHGHFSPTCRCRHYSISLLPFLRLFGHVRSPFEPKHPGRCDCSAPMLLHGKIRPRRKPINRGFRIQSKYWKVSPRTVQVVEHSLFTILSYELLSAAARSTFV